MSKTITIKKADAKEQIVFAEVYAPLTPDSDSDFMDAETIKTMAYKFMKDLNLKNIDVQHDNNLVSGACVVESFIARKGDDTFIEGAWVVGVHISDKEVWDKIEKQEINGFSLEAMVMRTEVEVEFNIPPVIAGLTEKIDGHEHEFLVSYDAQGNFLGGKTTKVDGHFHTIKRGTITEASDDHSHRFSYVEQISITELS